MKKSFKKMMAALLALVIAITAFAIGPMSALAVDTAKALESAYIRIWADPENVLTQEAIANYNYNDKTGDGRLTTLGGIMPFKNTSSASIYYWFLPSTADCTNLTFWFDGTATIDGQEITSGVPTDVFASLNEGGITRQVTVRLGSSSYNVVVMKSGDVGTVYITSRGTLSDITKDDKHKEWTTGSVMVVQPDGKVDYCGEMTKFSGRGNGTWSTTEVKNPYNMKLAKSTSLLGMEAAKKWCLLANSGDETLIKNQLTYDFADYIGIKYQPHCKPVDLYVNQQYLGSYQLAEKVEIKSNRINISDAYESLELANGTTDPVTGLITPADLSNSSVTTYNPNRVGTNTTNVPAHSITSKNYTPNLTNPDDITGGYLYELEITKRWVDEKAGFCAYNRQGWVMKSCNVASEEMVDYSYNLLYVLGSAVYNNGTVPSGETTTNCSGLSKLTVGTKGPISVTNPAPDAQYRGLRWSDILDADSAVRYYWTQEFFKNMDSSTSSTYFYKDSDAVDSTLYAGPMWDMDNSIGVDKNGSRWGYSWTSSTGWYTQKARMYRWRSEDSTTSYSKDTESPLNFYAALANNCSDFWAMAERYWFKYISPAVDVLTGDAVDPTGTLKSTAYYVDTVEKSGKMNAVRFGSASSTYENKTNKINTWFTQREEWVTNEITRNSVNIANASVAAIPNQSYTGSEITPELTITYNGTTLEEGVDYTLAYSNNVNANASSTVKSNVQINGINKFTGTNYVYFTIDPVDLSSCDVTIDSAAYEDSVLTVSVKNPDGVEITGFNTQWSKDGAAISGETDTSYAVRVGDGDSVITATVSGTGNFTGSKTSNECAVRAGERPVGFTKTIAQWNYEFTMDDSSALVNADETGESYYYTATAGENQEISSLYGTVNTVDRAKLKWSGDADEYKYSDGSKSQAPVMGTSKTASIGWGEYSYFETVTSTAGYEDIKFSALLGGTKKAPRSWKLQYSLDGSTYTDVEGAEYVITSNKTMEQAFDNVALPEACENQPTLYLRMVVFEDKAIDGVTPIVNQTSGDAAFNNIMITGSSLAVVTQLNAPTIAPASESVILNDENITLVDNNGGADVYYSVNGGEAQLYTGGFNPFTSDSRIGDTVTVQAWASFEEVESAVTTASYTYAGANINTFSYDAYCEEVVNGTAPSTSGAYGKSGKMTTYTDGVSQYVPLWNESHKAFTISPDDGAKWSDQSGFTFKVATAGFENIHFSCKAYTTNQGPASVTLQYSLDGVTFNNIQSDVALTANGALEQTFTSAQLPQACDNQPYVYIRLATTENLTFAGDTLHNNASKGNLYVNDVVISGEDNGELKMPYTNKSTSYFGATGTVKYVSPDGANMFYTVFDSKNNIVASGAYPSTGIKLSTVNGFDQFMQEPYRVMVWASEDESTSAVNASTYCYKGDTIVKFNYKDATSFADKANGTSTAIANTGGANAGTLSMYPNANDAATLSYTKTYGVKAAYDETDPALQNKFTATLKLDNPKNNGYWLIETSTAGYHNLTLNLEQLSSNGGPRDWGVAYSTNGTSYTYVSSSNARAISNDAVNSTVETYGNLPLPSACDDKETLYIKVFINGGETVKGDELELSLKGNTGINNIEICGNPILNFDVDHNGYVNAKDYAIITKNPETYPLENEYIDHFQQHISTASDLAQ